MKPPLARLLTNRRTHPATKNSAHGSTSMTPNQPTILPVFSRSRSLVDSSMRHQEMTARITTRATMPETTLPVTVFRKSMGADLPCRHRSLHDAVEREGYKVWVI